jgi:NTP pyrophosphatase (non-canonical NTP hydrolase)
MCENCDSPSTYGQTNDFDTYQSGASKTARGGIVLDGVRGRVAIASMGLAGESGEVIDYLKKWVGHGHELDREYVEKELGDVLWYLAEIATALEMDISTIAKKNADKLNSRYPQGFSTDRSINRG